MATFHENLVQSFRNFKERFIGDIDAGTVAQSLSTKTDKSESIKSITRSGTTFTATRADGTTFTFTQQDNNTTTGTSYNAGSCPDNTTFGTNGSIKRVYDAACKNRVINDGYYTSGTILAHIIAAARKECYASGVVYGVSDAPNTTEEWVYWNVGQIDNGNGVIRSTVFCKRFNNDSRVYMRNVFNDSWLASVWIEIMGR